MTPHALQVQNQSLKRQRNLVAVAAGLLLLTAWSTSAIAMRRNSEVILVPTLLPETAIQRNRAPDDYVLSMTRDAAQLFLNRHPHDTRYMRENVLRIVDPAYHDELKRQIAEDENDNKYKSGERVFFPERMCMVEGTTSPTAEIRGRLNTYLNDRKIETRDVIQRFVWRVDGYRLVLVDTASIDKSDALCVDVEGEES